MDWENERYVRVYRRDTTSGLLMAWDERSLFWELLRRVDMAGVLDLGPHGARGMAVHLRCPPDVAERALRTWVEVGWVEVTGTSLVIPNFIDAQEAVASDKERQRRSREKRRDVTLRDAAVTRSDANGSNGDQTVTLGHAVSHAVTPSLAEPSLAEPSQPSLAGIALSERVTADPSRKKPKKPKTVVSTRMTEDWTPPESFYDWAETATDVLFDRETVDRFLPSFRDYWIGLPGAKGKKDDWVATFRNDLRRQRIRHPNIPDAFPEPPMREPPPMLTGEIAPPARIHREGDYETT